MAVADAIEALVTRSPGLTEAEIAAVLLGDAGDPQPASNACRSLLRSRRIMRRGRGGRIDPVRYFPKGTLTALGSQVKRRGDSAKD
jgi:hypothetical protein